MASIITKTMGFNLSVTFLSLYLGYFPNKLSKDDAYLLKVLLAASKKAVIKCWLQKNAPTVGLFVHIVKQLHLLERMTPTSEGVGWKAMGNGPFI